MTRRLLATSALALLSVLAAASPALAAWRWPADGEVITSYLNGADPYAAGQHRGVDIAGPVGAPVVAATAGTVRFAGTVGSSGLTVSVRTSDGRLDLSYLHLSLACGRRRAACGRGHPDRRGGHHRQALGRAAPCPLRSPRRGQRTRVPRSSGLPVPAGRPGAPRAPAGAGRGPGSAAARAAPRTSAPGRAHRAPGAGCPSASRPRARAGAAPRRPARAAGCGGGAQADR